MTRGRISGVALCCLIIGSGACASRKEEATVGTTPGKEGMATALALDCTLSVPPRLRVGEPVEVHFRLGNSTAQPLYVLTWHTPLEGLLSNHLRVTRDGTEIPYEGPMFKRGDPEAEAYVTIAPGASAEAQVEASLAYDFRQPGRYRIEFRGPLMDVTPNGAEVPRPLAQHRAVPVQCPAVETTIVAP
jgi:hypothetical protein